MATKARTKAVSRKAGAAKKASRKAAKRPAKAKPKAKGRGPAKMKAYPSFDHYLDDRPPFHRRLITALREFVARTAPELQESVKWGNGCWLKGKVPIAYVYAADDYVQFGFIRGSSLADPLGLLEGDGQYVRHIKVRELDDIDEHAFSALLRQAAR